MKLKILFLFLIGMNIAGWSQRHLRDSAIGTPWVAVHYGANWTHGDLAKRYGYLNHIGAMAGYKTNKNWVFGLDGNFIFGNKIHMTGVFDGLTDSYGNVTDVNGDVGRILLFARGFNVNAMVGKVIPVFGTNANSGLYIHVGVGYLQHKLRVETNDQVIPSVELKYKKGYDRFSSGVNFHQFVGFAFLADHGFLNFYGGFYIQEGFTKNRRNEFYDQPDVPVPQGYMLDIQLGLKGGWFIPIYQRKPKDFYFD